MCFDWEDPEQWLFDANTRSSRMARSSMPKSFSGTVKSAQPSESSQRFRPFIRLHYLAIAPSNPVLIERLLESMRDNH